MKWIVFPCDYQKALEEFLLAKGKPVKFEDLKNIFLMTQTNNCLHHVIPANSLKKWWIKPENRLGYVG